MRRSGVRQLLSRTAQVLAGTTVSPPVMYAGLHKTAPEAPVTTPERASEIGTGKFEQPVPNFTAGMVRGGTRSNLTMSDAKTFIFEMHQDSIDEKGQKSLEAYDGNQAVAHAAYALSELSFIYPISPATPMGEMVDALSAAGRLNCFGQPMLVTEMQSEGGVAGALHGAVTAGALGVTFTSSQGLLLMLPNMYKIGGQGLPCVMHVPTRSLSIHATNMYCDHSDVMAARQAGWTMLCSENPQMAHDFALLSHLATISTSIPVLHFFDGFRTSHEVNKVDLVDYEALKAIIPYDDIERFRSLAITPTRPEMRGASHSPEFFFQGVEAANVTRSKIPEHLAYWTEKLSTVIHRKYAFYAYNGAPDAEHVVVLMGSGAVTATKAAKYLAARGKKVGAVSVRLFRPWLPEEFLHSLPKTVKRITVLDRTKEPGANGEALCMDVFKSAHSSKEFHNIEILHGRYGIGGKEFTPGMAVTVFENSMLQTPKDDFSVGIIDDVTFKSLPLPKEEPDVASPNASECLFYGLGSDGTVIANKMAVKIINKYTPLHAQAYFSYDAKKSGGMTVSHVRFDTSAIDAPYGIQRADYIAIHRENYVYRFDILKKLKVGGTVVLNTSIASAEEAQAKLPASFLRTCAEKKAKLYVINANKLATAMGLGRTINLIMQALFFKLRSVLPYEEAKRHLKEDIAKTFGKKQQSVIDKNVAAVDASERSFIEIPVPESWAQLPKPGPKPSTSDLFTDPVKKEYMKKIFDPVSVYTGGSIPVSAANRLGIAPNGTTVVEKRCIALHVPQVDMKKCIQCNYCSAVCPHAAIRPFLLTGEEAQAAPGAVKDAPPAQGGGVFDKYRFRVQVSPMDCTGCELCAHMCPADALKMNDVEKVVAEEVPNWDYCIKLPSRGAEIDVTSIRGSQFQQPLLEFSGACEGCGETAHVKLLTQLFGKRLVLANATGCSSVWCSCAPSFPYTHTPEGEGVSWARSLFEDNAEFGYGMRRAYTHRREGFVTQVEQTLADATVPMSSELRNALGAYVALAKLKSHDTLLKLGKSMFYSIYHRILPLLSAEYANHPKLQSLYATRELFSRISHWLLGGDGWAFDIGFGGLDHVLCSGEHIKCLVLDTEVYSNTGGQASKATPTGAVVKFAEAGKQTQQKDLGQYAMSLRSVYVASICLEADPHQALRALLEAEQYPGPALVISYCPCLSHGYKLSESISHCRQIVDSGMWPLYRYNPQLVEVGNNPFHLDSKIVDGRLFPLLQQESRFSTVMRTNPQRAKELDAKLASFVQERSRVLSILGQASHAAEASAERTSTSTAILYGSETGHAEDQARSLFRALTLRGMKGITVCALDDFDFKELPKLENLIVVVSTCGLGEFPKNSRKMWQALQDNTLAMTHLSNVKYTVFGLGDSSYGLFCAAAQAYDVRLQELGAQRVLPRGVGDDQDEDGYFTGWESWTTRLWPTLQVPNVPVGDIPVPKPEFEVMSRPASGSPVTTMEQLCPPGAVNVMRTKKVLLTPEGYDRDIRHYEFDITPSASLNYDVGDSVAIYAHTPKELVSEMMQMFRLDGTSELIVTPLVDHPSKFIPNQLNVEQLFSCVLDLCGKPPKGVYGDLSAFATDPAEKAALKEINGEPGQYKHYSEELKVNYRDLFKRFPSCRPPLAQLISLIPRIKPRLYSISSSPLANTGRLSATIVKVDGGLCTRYLIESPSEKMWIRIQKSGIALPKDPKTPLIMVAMGTGLAPWRAVVQHRAAMHKAGTSVGEMILYFGARHEKTEFLYRDEFHKFCDEGLLKLRLAFSRDQAHKIYVQHRLEEDGATIYDLMVNKGAYFYVCGAARQLPADVFAAMKTVILKNGPANMDENQADAMLASWKLAGRYTVEAFS